MAIKSLFVYGTLVPGRQNEHILKNMGGSWKQGSVTGKLYQEGWGAKMGYPAIILDKQGDEINGFLFSFDNYSPNTLSKYWKELDEFEGDEYERVIVNVNLEDNKTADAYIYALKK